MSCDVARFGHLEDKRMKQNYAVRVDIEVEAPTEDLAGELVMTILDQLQRNGRIEQFSEIEINKCVT